MIKNEYFLVMINLFSIDLSDELNAEFLKDFKINNSLKETIPL